MQKGLMIKLGILIAGAVLAAALMLADKSKKDDGEVKQVDGFSTVTSVQGCEFLVNNSFTGQATAINAISDDMGITTSDFYSYKNGDDQYLLFRMDGIVVAVQKDTHFHIFEASDKKAALQSADLLGIWLQPDPGGLKEKTKEGRYTCNAAAQVVITNDIFNDFSGKFVCLTDGTTEWSMFVGIPADRYKSLSSTAKKGINTIADSFVLRSANEAPGCAMTITGSEDEKQEETPADEPAKTDENKVVVKPTVQEKKKTEEPIPSSPYSMLNKGQPGHVQYGDGLYACVKLERILTPQEVRQKAAESKDMPGEFEEVPAGCYEGAVYSTDVDTSNVFLGMHLIGLDGEELKFRGIRYPVRTYEISKGKKSGDGTKDILVYYPVPNGCGNYALEIYNSPELECAYYAVKATAVR